MSELGGKIPVRVDIPIVPSSGEVGFMVKHYLGVEILNHFPLEGQEPEHITEVQEGQAVLVPGIMGGYIPMKITQNQEGNWRAENESMSAVLDFDSERACWVATALINLKAIKTLRLER